MSMKSTVQINLSVFGIAILLSFLGVEKVNADEIRTPVKYRNDNRSKPIAKKNLQSATKQDLTVDAPPINGVDEELKQKEIKKLPDAGKAASV
ncbi:MAG: hypothetical protein NT027_17615, partial [Proteobacteria bacterium]|nr:hypothetical protein [Pseudomonadota bacterium]